MAVTFRQWVDAFDSTTAETGCSVSIANPQTFSSEITATIASASDTADQATENITSGAKLPAGSEGRVRFKFRTPAGLNLLANSVFFRVHNAAGNQISELFMNSSQLIKVYIGPAGILNTTGGVVDPSPDTTLADDTEYTIEYAWRKNGFARLWVNGSQVLDFALSGATGDAVATEARVGIDHYDGADTSGWTAKYRLFQLADDAATALIDPGSYTIVNGSDETLTNVNAGGTDISPNTYKDGVALTETELATLLNGTSFGARDIAVFPDLTGVAQARQRKKATLTIPHAASG